MSGGYDCQQVDDLQICQQVEGGNRTPENDKILEQVQPKTLPATGAGTIVDILGFLVIFCIVSLFFTILTNRGKK